MNEQKSKEWWDAEFARINQAILEEEQKFHGKSTTKEQAFSEGYKAKYNTWCNRDNRYPEDSELHKAFEKGYSEAVLNA